MIWPRSSLHFPYTLPIHLRIIISTLLKSSHLSELFPVKTLTGIAVTEAETRAFLRLWVRLLGERCPYIEDIMWAEDGVGKAAEGCSQCRELNQQEGEEERDPFLTPFYEHLDHVVQWRLSTPWTFSYTSLVLLKPLGVHSFTCKWNSHDLSIMLTSIVWSGLDWGTHLSSTCDKCLWLSLYPDILGEV